MYIINSIVLDALGLYKLVSTAVLRIEPYILGVFDFEFLTRFHNSELLL